MASLITNQLLNKADVISLYESGSLLIKPGTGFIASESINVAKHLTRDVLNQHVYLDGYNPGLIDGEILLTGITFEYYEELIFIPDPAVNGIDPNSGTYLASFVSKPTILNRIAHYGYNTGYTETVSSPTLARHGNNGYTGTTIVASDAANTVRLKIKIGRKDLEQTTYSYSTTGTTTELSNILRLGNIITIQCETISTPSNCYIRLEISENGRLTNNEIKYVAGNGSGTITIDNFRIINNTNYTFKAYVTVSTPYNGAFSNVTGQRACNLLT
jgi:hypothetical protein